MTAQIAVLIGLGINFAGLVLSFIALRRKQNEIHVLVNSKLDAALARGVQLTDTLKEQGIDVPEVPELKPVKKEDVLCSLLLPSLRLSSQLCSS